jgi:F0F1-type ATP synthase membrane subunit b/b'
MFALVEENETMRLELDVLNASTFEERTAEVAQDNKRLRRRNGELQIELMDTKAELKKLKQSVAHLPNGASAQ